VAAEVDLKYFVSEKVAPTSSIQYLRLHLLSRAAASLFAGRGAANQSPARTIDAGSASPSNVEHVPELAEAFGRAALDAWGSLAVMHVLHELTHLIPHPDRPETEMVRDPIRALVSKVLQPGLQALPGVYPPSNPEEPPPFMPVILEGMEDSFRCAIRVRAAVVFRAAIPASVAQRLGRAMAVILRDEGEALGVQWGDTGPLPARATRVWASRRDVQAMVQAALNGQSRRLAEALRSTLRDAAERGSTPWWSADPVAWWFEWLVNVAESAMDSPNAWRWIDWDTSPAIAFTEALHAVATTLSSRHTSCLPSKAWTRRVRAGGQVALGGTPLQLQAREKC
jgi:hypothetical protein